MIYFVRRGQDGPIKIGFALDPRVRIRALQTASPEPLLVLGLVPGGSSREAEIHRQLREYRINREWFAPAREVFALLSQLQTPEYRVVNYRAYAVLRRPSEDAPSRPCPFCGSPHTHGKEDGHRIVHCGDNAQAQIHSENVTLRREDGYYVETDGPPS